ncbi:MAG TPA: CapA family protein [Dehalococcoidales bacterium]|nr:CapA family protein [Dehalococcoidales bacterium]
MNKKAIKMLCVGDLLLYKTNNERVFDLVSPVFKSADIVVGQAEGAYTTRPHITCAQGGGADMAPARTGDPSVFKDIKAAGFQVLTLANNHLFDGGIPGVEDTLAELKGLGVATVGVGMNLDEARRPAVIERNGVRVGFLNYNCVGPKITWANAQKPGCAYVQIFTVYEMENPGPGEKPTGIFTVAEFGSLKAMTEDIRKLRPLCDVLAVKFHKGAGFVEAKIEQYEFQVSYAAIDAGADVVLADHAHILKGIEVYRGKPIYHGMNHFAMSFPYAPITDSARISKMVANYKEHHGFDADPETVKYMYPTRDTLKTIVASLTITNGKITRAGYLPCLIDMKTEQPEILKHDARGEEVFGYIDRITKAAGLNTRYDWEGDEVVFLRE